ncbi:MAG: hypothetical protein KDD58_08200 [Bdellovibrionales bacterium]|nr:hypothetical protein [Bdellovibrionales bacterium]
MAKRVEPISLVIVLSLGVLLFFQNCEDVDFSTTTESTKIETFDQNNQINLNEDVDPVSTEEPTINVECEEGKHFGVWLDSDNDGSIDGEQFLGSIVPFNGNTTAVKNYNYYSASAHPLVGPAPAGFDSKVFFYEGKDGLALNFFFNIDEGGSADNRVNWDIEVIGNDKKDRVLLSDDNGEIDLVETTNFGHIYEARFHYWENTDGGIIGPFVGDDFLIKINVLNSGDIQNATFFSANNHNFSLKDKNNQVSSFIIGFLEYRKCN